jgi:hypothetical protein
MVTDLWPCPRCGRWVDVSFPSGEPVVRIYAARFFHAPRLDGAAIPEPAGNAQALICLRCDMSVWPFVEDALPRKRWVEGPDGC